MTADDDTCFCGRPLPPRICVMFIWCDHCLDEWDATGPRGQREDMNTFIERKTGTWTTPTP